jgi:hypothetical protein
MKYEKSNHLNEDDYYEVQLKKGSMEMKGNLMMKRSW